MDEEVQTFLLFLNLLAPLPGGMSNFVNVCRLIGEHIWEQVIRLLSSCVQGDNHDS